MNLIKPQQQNYLTEALREMKGIQINNFFNNHISLNSKKLNANNPNNYLKPNQSHPIVINHTYKNQDQEQTLLNNEANSPHLKPNKKDNVSTSARKKRTNTVAVPLTNKRKAILKSKEKQKVSSSLEQMKKTVSAEKQYSKDTSEQNEFIKPTTSGNYKKSKLSTSIKGVKRSKSAIIKSSHSRPIESKQISKMFLKQSKKNIFNTVNQNSFKKNSLKKLIKKQTQQLINQKQQTQKRQCKTERNQGVKNKVARQKSTDKISKFNTQKKSSASRTYETSAKQSKPVSARQKKVNKKLFESKQKDSSKEQDRKELYKKLEAFTKKSNEQSSSQMKQVMSQLQNALLNINSKKALAKQLKKFTSKLKQASSSEQDSLSEEQQSNSEAFKRIKNIGLNNLNEPKAFNGQKSIDQHIGIKKSSKKLIKNKKKLDDYKQIKNDGKKGKQTQKNNSSKKPHHKSQKKSKKSGSQLQPECFKNTEQQQSKYLDSNHQALKTEHQEDDSHQAIQLQQKHEPEQLLNQNNKNYMQFLKNLESEPKRQFEYEEDGSQSKSNYINNDSKQQSEQYQLYMKNESNSIEDINTYLNAKNNNQITNNRLYDSQKPRQSSIMAEKMFNNPILQRKRIDNFDSQYLNDDQAEIEQLGQKGNLSDKQYQQDDLKSQQNKFDEIQKFKEFQRQSDKIMQKLNTQNKKKNLTIELNQAIRQKNSQEQHKDNYPSIVSKPALSPKYNDHYPQLIKSPKFSDVQITSILSIKQKCLASKHQKMNELIQKMYQKQLVSPKSYEYSMYQLKKQFEQQSDGLDGFKQQASQILNEINRDKDDIKGIDELIREEKWQEARKLMKMDCRTASVFSGFKKSKDKIYEQQYQGWEKVQVKEKLLAEAIEQSPVKTRSVSLHHNINIVIQPSPVSIKAVIKQQKIVADIKSQKIQKTNNNVLQSKGLLREKAAIIHSDSSDEQIDSQPSESIAQKLDFQFEQKYKLKSLEDDKEDQKQNKGESKSNDYKNLQQQFSQYLNVEKADSQDFQHYVYYQNQELQDKQMSQNNSGLSIQVKGKQLKQEGMFKLIEVSHQNKKQIEQMQENKTEQYELPQESDQQYGKDSILKKNINKGSKINKINNDKIRQNVIQIDDQDVGAKSDHQNQSQKSKVISVTNTENKISDQNNQQQLQDNQSENNSLIELQIRKGFESNLFFIKQYCISLCEFIRDNEQRKNQFKQKISHSLQYNTQRLLKNYRKTIHGEYDDRYNTSIVELQYINQFRNPHMKAISLQLATQFNKTYGPLKFFNVDLTKKKRQKFQMEKTAEKIFLQAILEVLNESLDFQRPGSIFGKPLPWASSSKYLKNMKYLKDEKKKKVADDSEESAQTYDFIFGVAIARIIQWGSCLCGFLPDTAELQNTQIDEDYVVHIRQTRMAFLLQKMLAQQEATINNSQLQQGQILLYLGKQIIDGLMQQASEQIKNIQDSKNKSNLFQYQSNDNSL